MASCLACNRPVALARATCLYCGAALRAEDVPTRAVEQTPALEPSTTDREFVLVDVAGCGAQALVEAFGVSSWDAGQIVRRGGEHLLGSFPDEEAARIENRIAAFGLRVFRVPVSEVRARPLLATGGSLESDSLELETTDGLFTLSPASLLLIVEGPITRRVQAGSVKRKIHSFHPEDGHRIHIHLREGGRPFEIDPGEFELRSAGVTGSTLLDIRGGLDSLALLVPRDKGFRHQVPALAPPEAPPESSSGRTALRAIRGMMGDGAQKERDRAIVLDNASQFRLYSGLRCAVERRR